MECMDQTEAKVSRKPAAGREIPERLNLAIATIVLFVYLSLFFGVSLLAGRYFLLFALLAFGFLLSTPAIWGLVHEGIHGRLLRHPSANRGAKRLQSSLSPEARIHYSCAFCKGGHLLKNFDAFLTNRDRTEFLARLFSL